MVFPLGDDNSDRVLYPIVTTTLIAVNVLVFVLLQGMGNNDDFTMSYSTVPAEILSGEDKVTPPRTIEFDTPQGVEEVTVPGLGPTRGSVYITLLTSMFMHGGVMHLLGNMWFLWIFGDNIENDMGRPRYTAYYLLCGLLASLAHVFLNATGEGSMTPSLGASGAISGVMGGYLVLHPHRRVTVLLFRFVTAVPGWVAVGLWFAFQLVSGLGMLGGDGGGVAYGAHIGGFIAGALLAMPFMVGKARAPNKRQFEDPYDRGPDY